MSILTVEVGLLGSIMTKPELTTEVDLLPSDFVSSTHQAVYKAILDLDKSNEPIDIITINDYLSKASGRDWLLLLGEMHKYSYSPKNIGHYTQLIKIDAQKRLAIAIAETLTKNIGESTQESIDVAIRDLMALNATKKDYTCSLNQALTATVDYMQLAIDGQLHGVSSGLKKLDDSLGGFQKTDLYVMGARPAMGKTAFLLNLANACGKPAGIISGEQPREQIGLRFISMNSRVPAHNLRKADIEDYQWSKVTQSVSSMHKKKLWLFDKPAPSIMDVIREARKWKFQYDIKALYVDYIQKISASNKSQPRHLQVEEVVSSLKNLARELEIPVIALAQVARKVEERPNKRPFMSDMSDSSSIEKEADNIMTLYRDDVYHPDSSDKGIAELCVLKNRHGPIGTFMLNWVKEYMVFNEDGFNHND